MNVLHLKINFAKLYNLMPSINKLYLSPPVPHICAGELEQGEWVSIGSGNDWQAIIQSKKLILTYCQLHSWEWTIVKFYSKYKTFHSWKCISIYICETATILSRGRWVKSVPMPTYLCVWPAQDAAGWTSLFHRAGSNWGVSLSWALLIHTYRDTSSRWLQVAWRYIATRPSATTMLIWLWLLCHKYHVTSSKQAMFERGQEVDQALI